MILTAEVFHIPNYLLYKSLIQFYAKTWNTLRCNLGKTKRLKSLTEQGLLINVVAIMAALSVVDNSKEHSDEIYRAQAQVDNGKTVQ